MTEFIIHHAVTLFIVSIATIGLLLMFITALWLDMRTQQRYVDYVETTNEALTSKLLDSSAKTAQERSVARAFQRAAHKRA